MHGVIWHSGFVMDVGLIVCIYVWQMGNALSTLYLVSMSCQLMKCSLRERRREGV